MCGREWGRNGDDFLFPWSSLTNSTCLGNSLLMECVDKFVFIICSVCVHMFVFVFKCCFQMCCVPFYSELISCLFSRPGGQGMCLDNFKWDRSGPNLLSFFFFFYKHIQQEQPGGHKSLRGWGGTATVWEGAYWPTHANRRLFSSLHLNSNELALGFFKTQRNL